MMDHLPRFRRRPKHPTIKTDAARPVTAPGPSPPNRDTTPPPALPVPPRKQTDKFLKVASLKGLHIRSPGKRARSPDPASLPPSPPVSHDVSVEGASSPLAKSDASAGGSDSERIARRESRKRVKGRTTPDSSGKPAIPSFLTQSDMDLMHKFYEITWMERNRLAFGPCVLEHIDPRPNPEAQPEPKRMGMDRYCNIKPWSHNRVKLKVSGESLDYVNASHVELSSSSDLSLPPLKYIAMQGPTQHSLEYVWRMVAEQFGSSAVIVQLTNMVEHGAQKCFPYFPLQKEEPWQINEGDEWGDGWRAEVGFEQTESLADGAIELTKLRLKVEGEKNDRTVWHFLYTRWPDFGAPAMEDLDSFFELMQLSKEYAEGQPRVVHCSAGVGRTGTFISLEHLMRELEGGHFEDHDGEEEGPDVVFETVDELRTQRKSMVQAESQFLFVYRVLKKLWEKRYGSGEKKENEQGKDGAEEEEDGEPRAKRVEVEEGTEG